MEETFLRFEVEIMELGDLENIMDCTVMVIEVGMGGDSDIVHIDADCCSKGFMFENDILVDIVHHGLEHRWRVGESEIHDCGFEKSVSGFKRCFLLVSFTDPHVIISPSDVKLRVYVGVTEVSNEVCDQGERVLIVDRDRVDFSIILHWSHFSILFVNKEEGRCVG